MKTIDQHKPCEVADCHHRQEALVHSRDCGAIMAVCNLHARAILDRQICEYETTCPNCGCEMPVN